MRTQGRTAVIPWQQVRHYEQLAEQAHAEACAQDGRPFVVGQTAIFCGVPEYDYPRGIFHAVTIRDIWPDGQMIVDSEYGNGSRTGVPYIWHDEGHLRRHVEQLEAMRQIDADMERNAR